MFCRQIYSTSLSSGHCRFPQTLRRLCCSLLPATLTSFLLSLAAGQVQPTHTGCLGVYGLPGLQVLDKLQEKRALVERELTKIPGAPTTRDVFQLCRGFERAFAYTIDVRPSHISQHCSTLRGALWKQRLAGQSAPILLQKTDYAGLIRRTFQDEGLAGAVSKLPLEKKFKLEIVKEVRTCSMFLLNVASTKHTHGTNVFWLHPGCQGV